MTRINTVDPVILTDQHLMAEYRELPMVHASLSRSLSSKRGVRHSLIPEKYTLNKGHVTFFYNKGKWLFNRWTALIEELKYRGFDVRPEERVVNWKVFTDNNLYNDWCPDNEAHRVNIERIIERCQAKADWYKYHGQRVPYTIWSEYERICVQ